MSIVLQEVREEHDQDYKEHGAEIDDDRRPGTAEPHEYQASQ